MSKRTRKRAARRARRDRGADGALGPRGQGGVGVQEQEEFGVRRRGAAVELAAAARRARDGARPKLAGDFQRAVGAAAVGDHDLVGDRQDGGEVAAERPFFVQRGNHDRQPHGVLAYRHFRRT